MGKKWQDERNEEIEHDSAKPSAPKPKPVEEKIVLAPLPVYRGRPPERDMPVWGMKAIHDF